MRTTITRSNLEVRGKEVLSEKERMTRGHTRSFTRRLNSESSKNIGACPSRIDSMSSNPRNFESEGILSHSAASPFVRRQRSRKVRKASFWALVRFVVEIFLLGVSATAIFSCVFVCFSF